MKQTAVNIIKRLSKADIPFYILPLMMLNLLAGTLAQGPWGLYKAQKVFFSSFITWAGPLPLPGGYTLLTILTVCLTLKFIFHSRWQWNKTGINLTHLGVLILLIGGLFTASTARESYMVIPEGQSTPYVYDYIQRSLFIFEDDKLLYALPLPLPETLNDLKLPFTIAPVSYCGNCEIIRAENPPDNARAMARFMDLTPKPPEKTPEDNLTGLTFTLSGLPNAQENGLYVAFENMPAPIEIRTGEENTYKIIAGKQQRMLPFELQLINFEKHTYPGTDKARDYSSSLIVRDGTLDWPAHIEMNEPLRYKGYTFYQSSFEQTEGFEATILSVVENKGRLFPYISAAIIAAGLLLHLMIIQRKTAALLILLAAPLLSAQPAIAADITPTTPILYEGRIQPIDSFARTQLKAIHGRSKIDGLSPTAWLNESLNAPKDAVGRELFLIRNPQLKSAMQLPDTRKHFTIIEIQEGLIPLADQLQSLAANPDTTPTQTQQDLLTLADRAGFITNLLLSGGALPPGLKTLPNKAQSWKISLEYAYNIIRPFTWTMTLYLLALLLMRWPQYSRPAFIAAIAAHTAAIAMRVLILSRPPVGTLHESILFVALICALSALLLSRKNTIAIPAGSFCALGLLALAPALSQGEDLQLLVAVLNTNFWLTTHVLCITAGYGICIITSVLAHLTLSGQKQLHQTIHRLSIAALFFTAFGTILGGIWADQSWGRFWGWDPKENGALLITLWLIWLQHGRYSGKLSQRAFLAGTAALSIIVALAWFGVNLLSVGLHSYGFISGIAGALGAFCSLELIIIAALWIKGQGQNHANQT